MIWRAVGDLAAGRSPGGTSAGPASCEDERRRRCEGGDWPIRGLRLLVDAGTRYSRQSRHAAIGRKCEGADGDAAKFRSKVC